MISTGSDLVEDLSQNIDKSYFHISRSRILYLSLLSALLFILLAIAGINDIWQSRLYFSLIGPILSFSAFILFFLWIVYEESKEPGFPLIFEYSVIAGIASIIIAISLNSRAFLIIVTNFIEIDQQELGVVVAIGIVGPLIEEFAKALPIFYLVNAKITRSGSDREQRILNNGKIPIFIGLITGAIFNVLETYWYIFNSGIVFTEFYEWNITALQIVLRAVNPIHMVAAAFSGYGVSLALWSNRGDSIGRNQFSTIFKGFMVAFVIHSLWNTSAILGELFDWPSTVFFGYSIPLANVVLMLVSQILLLLLITQMSKFSSAKCDFCGNWHIPPYEEEDHEFYFEPRTTLIYRIIDMISKKKNKYTCKNCKDKIENNTCRCGASNIFQCPKCKYSVPAYATICWYCQQELIPPFKNVFEYPISNTEKISVGMAFVFAGFYAPSSIVLLIYHLKNSRGYTNTLIISVFYLILAFVYIIMIKWYFTPTRRSIAISLARSLFGMVIIQYALFLIFILSYIKEIATNNEFISIVLVSINIVILLYYAFKVIFDHNPLFHEEGNK